MPQIIIQALGYELIFQDVQSRGIDRVAKSLEPLLPVLLPMLLKKGLDLMGFDLFSRGASADPSAGFDVKGAAKGAANEEGYAEYSDHHRPYGDASPPDPLETAFQPEVSARP